LALLHRLRPKKIEADTEILEGVASRADEVAGREGYRNKIEPAAIEFLRENSNYLTLKKALLSGDTWSLVAVYLRNLMLNWLIILPLLGGVVVLPGVMIFLGVPIIPPNYSLWLSLFVAILAIWYPTFIAFWEDIPQDGDSLKRGIMDISGYLVPAPGISPCSVLSDVLAEPVEQQQVVQGQDAGNSRTRTNLSSINGLANASSKAIGNPALT